MQGRMTMNARDARDRLQAGNLRFTSNAAISEPTVHHATNEQTISGQSPYATILTCADSRVTPEIIFDEGIGSLFVVRTAGAIARSSQMSSLEFAVGQLNCPLIVVMGHSGCGAIAATLGYLQGQDVESPHLQTLVEHISSCLDHQHLEVNEAAKKTAMETCQQIISTSSMIQEAIAQDKLQVVPAMYDFLTGGVEFL